MWNLGKEQGLETEDRLLEIWKLKEIEEGKQEPERETEGVESRYMMLMWK